MLERSNLILRITREQLSREMWAVQEAQEEEAAHTRIEDPTQANKITKTVINMLLQLKNR